MALYSNEGLRLRKLGEAVDATERSVALVRTQ